MTRLEFLERVLEALDSLPRHRLCRAALWLDGDVCAMGAFGKRFAGETIAVRTLAKRYGFDPDWSNQIVDLNDKYRTETPEQRFARVRNAVVEMIGLNTKAPLRELEPA